MAGRTSDPDALTRVPALDGLRGLAVLGVLAFHGQLAIASGGFLGVSAFFTLSGFLITSLLLLERERTGRIGLLRFWTRRARRLLPAALVALAGIAVYGAFVATGHQASRIGGDGLSALAYVANWRFVIGDQSYAALFSAPSPVQHFWSLAIEEQFYLVFPLMLIGLCTVLRTRVGLRRALLVLTAASIATGWLLWSPGHDPARVYYGTDTRAAELLIGAVLATMLAGRRRSRVRGRRIATATAGSVALVLLVVAWATFSQSTTFLYRGGFALHALLTALVIAAARLPRPVARVLAIRPLRELGLVSYGVYLYHWPIFLWLDSGRVGIDGFALFVIRCAVTLGVAVASYRWVEQPIRAGRRITGWQPRLAFPLTAAAIGALLVALPASASDPIVFAAVRPGAGRPAKPVGTQVLAEQVRRSDSLARTQNVATVATTAPTLPAAPPPPLPVRRIMVVGDSVALTLGRGLERWGPPNGVAVFNDGRAYCPIARGGRLAATLGHTAEACADWPTAWPAALRRFQPDLVVVLTTVWDVSGRQRDDWGPHFVGPGDPRFDQMLRSEWSEAVRVLSSTGARVVWLDTPCMSNPDTNHDIDVMNTSTLPSVRAQGAVTLDLGAFVCPHHQFTGSLAGVDDIRPDGLHFSDAGADLVARWLGPQLTNPLLGNAPTTSPRPRRE
ncbi:MAG: DUF459 domain-containing protein [Acidimicrobiia bacterium]